MTEKRIVSADGVEIKVVGGASRFYVGQKLMNTNTGEIFTVVESSPTGGGPSSVRPTPRPFLSSPTESGDEGA